MAIREIEISSITQVVSRLFQEACHRLPPDVLAALEKKVNSPIIQVLPVHAEVEGGPYSEAFENILNTAHCLGYKIIKMVDAAADLDKSSLESRPIKQGIIAGRAFECAV